MPRTINASTITALGQDEIKMCHLVQIDFPSVIRITDSFYDIVSGGDTFTASGHFLDIGQPRETEELRVGSVGISLSAVDKAYVSIFLAEEYLNRRVRIWKAVLDSANQVIGDAISVFDGEITGYAISEDASSAIISVSCASHWADFERKAGRLTNNNSQQFYFSTDTGFRFAAESIKDIKWGKK